MTFVASNDNGFDVYLFVNNEQYLLEAGASDVHIESNLPNPTIYAKRVHAISAPNHKKLLMQELFGIIAALFMGPIYYIFDVSVEYFFRDDGKDTVQLRIGRMIKDLNPDWIYDAVCIHSPDLLLISRNYRVENRQEISRMYKKVRKTAHFWHYLLLELLFTLLGIVVSYPFLIAGLLATDLVIFKALMIVVPFFMIVGVALLAILPMHFAFKFQDARFDQAMSSNEIRTQYLKA